MSSFLQFAELCDALAATSKKLEKRAFMADYLKSLSVEDAGRAALWLSGTPFAETDPRVLNIGGIAAVEGGCRAVRGDAGGDERRVSSVWRLRGGGGGSVVWTRAGNGFDHAC